MDIEKPPTVVVLLPPGPGRPAGVPAWIGAPFNFMMTPGETEEYHQEVRADIAAELLKRLPHVQLISGNLPGESKKTKKGGKG